MRQSVISASVIFITFFGVRLNADENIAGGLFCPDNIQPVLARVDCEYSDPQGPFKGAASMTGRIVRRSLPPLRKPEFVLTCNAVCQYEAPVQLKNKLMCHPDVGPLMNEEDPVPALSSHCPATAIGRKIVKLHIDNLQGIDPEKLSADQVGRLCLYASSLMHPKDICQWSKDFFGTLPQPFTLLSGRVAPKWSDNYPKSWEGATGTIAPYATQYAPALPWHNVTSPEVVTKALGMCCPTQHEEEEFILPCDRKLKNK